MRPSAPPSSAGSKWFCIILGTVFGALFFLEHLAPFVLPVGYFYFRPWEKMEAGHQPLRTMEIENGFGDLANMIGLPRYRVLRHFVWTNDAYGRHNPLATQHDHPDIVAGGDSFMAGAADSDDAIFAVQLQRLTGRSTSTYARETLQEYFADERFREHPPSVLVWGMAERGLTGDAFAPLLQDTTCFAPTSALQSHLSDWKRMLRTLLDPLIAYTRQSILRKLSRPIIAEVKDRWMGQRNPDVSPAPDGSGMLFYFDGIRMLDVPAAQRKYDVLALALRHVQDCLAQRGTRFLFLPIPDKEHVYIRLLNRDPLSPDSLLSLAAALQAHGVHTVNLITPFQAQSGTGAPLLFWPDDTHWNGRGMLMAAEETAAALQNSERVGESR